MPIAAAGMLEPTAAAQVVEGVDEEPDARRARDRAAALGDLGAGGQLRGSTRAAGRATTHAPRRPVRSTGGVGSLGGGGPTEKRAASSTANPSAMATARESTTWTGTGDVSAASWAARTVPDSSPERWIETISRAPDAAARS